MAIENFPQEVKKFEIETYERPKNLKGLRKKREKRGENDSSIKGAYPHG